jgi:hypothetical protein
MSFGFYRSSVGHDWFPAALGVYLGITLGMLLEQAAKVYALSWDWSILIADPNSLHNNPSC